MIRKVQKSGKLYFISLPIKWVNENKIKKGEELECVIKDSQLILNTEKQIEKKLELKVSETNPEGLIHLVIGAFESGASEITIHLLNKLNNEQIKTIKKTLFKHYSLNMVEVSEDCIKVSVFVQRTSLEEAVKTLFNSTINLGRAVLLGDKELIKMHEGQVQFLRFTTKRLINVDRESPNWIIVADSLGVIARTFLFECENNSFHEYFKKVIELLQRMVTYKDNLDKVLRIMDDVLKLKKDTFVNGVRHYDLDRAYRSLVLITRELIKINVESLYFV